MKFSVDPWDVEYGTSAELEAESAGTAVVDIELPAGEWRPLDAWAAAGAGVGSVLFVDGVRRIDARVWIDGDNPGICASYAAGAVRCDGRAEVVDIAVARGMFSTAATAADIVTRHATYPARMAGANDIAALMLAVHERMTDVEVGIAGRVDGADLVVIDGPLRARTHIDHAVGFIKSHAVRYLPEELHRVVGALGRGAADTGVHGGVDVEPALVVLAAAGAVGIAVVGRRAVRVLARSRTSGGDRAGEHDRRGAPAVRVRAAQGHPRRRRTCTRSAASNDICATGWVIRPCCFAAFSASAATA